MYNYITLRLGLFLILNRNILSDGDVPLSPSYDASCSLPTDIINNAWQYNYTKVSDNSPQSTVLRVSTTTLQNSIINLNVVGTIIRDWTCINSLALSNTQTLVLFKSDKSFSNGPFAGNRWLYLCMKFTKVTTDLYYFYLLSDISNDVTPNERVFVSEDGHPPANDAPMCSTFCKYTGSPKIRTLRRPETSDEIPDDAALCEPCDSTCEVEDKMSTDEKSTDLGSKMAFYVGIPVLLLILVIIIIVAFVIWKKRTRQSTFGVNSNTNSDGHKNGENELTEVEQNLVVKT